MGNFLFLWFCFLQDRALLLWYAVFLILRPVVCVYKRHDLFLCRWWWTWVALSSLSNCSDTADKCFVTPFVTYVKPLLWYLSCGLRWILIPGSIIGEHYGGWRRVRAQSCMFLWVETHKILLNVLFQGSFLMGDVLPFVRGCPWCLEALSSGACTSMGGEGIPSWSHHCFTALFLVISNFSPQLFHYQVKKKQKLIVQA